MKKILFLILLLFSEQALCQFNFGSFWKKVQVTRYEAYVKGPDTVGIEESTGDSFGSSISIDGDTLVVGASGQRNLTGAAYVFKRSGSTWTQEAYLKASNADTSDKFGTSVSISGDTVVVGAIGEASNATGVNGDGSNNSSSFSGAVYVFKRSGSTWSQEAYLKASNADINDGFGESVSISGDTVVVGAGSEDSNATGVNGDGSNNSNSLSGAAYIFKRSGSTWSQEAYLKASNTDTLDLFGRSVSIYGDTLVVGASGEDSNATGINGDGSNNSGSSTSSGAAYIFKRSGSTWSQEAYLKASNTGFSDQFGASVSISGDTVVVGAHSEASNATGVNGDESNNSGFNPGAAYIFKKSGSTWSQEAYLKASNTGDSDSFGTSVSISGDSVVVGAHSEASNATGINGDGSNNSSSGSGAAYIFKRSGSTWSQEAYLKASNADAFDRFGESVSISGDTVVVGAISEDSNATGINGDESDNSSSFSGAVYAFERSITTWSQQAYLKVDQRIFLGGFDFFGTSVAIDLNTIVVGAPGEDSSSIGVNGDSSINSSDFLSSGAAYIFKKLRGNWTQEAYLKASNAGASDAFGTSVSISGDTVVVGARFEASSATGVNGDGSNNSSSFSGAAYVFKRSGSTWSQESYLKASNAGVNDLFGTSVSISGDTVVVGALSEGSNATGVNGDGSNNSSLISGAAYVFKRSGSTWTQEAYLKASNAGVNDQFGASVSISGDTVVVGARFEASNATVVNGDGSNNSSSFSGAAYVFKRLGVVWTQEAYLKAPNTDERDEFGQSVGISGDRVIIGAQLEDGGSAGLNGDGSSNVSRSSGAAYIFKIKK